MVEPGESGFMERSIVFDGFGHRGGLGGAIYTAGAATHKYIRVVEVDSANKPIAVGDAILNLG